MMHIAESNKLFVTESKDAEGYTFDADIGLSGAVLKSGKIGKKPTLFDRMSPTSIYVVNISDAYKDSRFSPRLDELKNFRTKSVLCVPIVVEKCTVGVVNFLNKLDRTGKITSFESRDEAIALFVCGCASVALRKDQLYQCALREKHRAKASLDILKALADDNSVEATIQKCIGVVYDFLGAEFVTLYMCDHSKRNAWICVSRDSLLGLTVSFGQGIAGTVAMTGKTIRIDDVYADDRFCKDVDDRTGIKTKNMICVPVPGFEKSSMPIAVLQVINKGHGLSFDSFDEECLNLFCDQLSMLLQRKLYELCLFRVSSSARSELGSRAVTAIELEKSFLCQFGSIKRNHVSEFFSDPGYYDGAHTSHYTSAHFEIDSLLSFDFNPFEETDDCLVEYAVQIFSSFCNLKDFGIEVTLLRKFMISVKNSYRLDVCFHNYKHAWSVFHVTYMILRHGQVAAFLDVKAIFSVLIAAICHDLDHPGHSNSFEVESNSQLAVLYSYESILERHHCATALRLAMSPDHNLFKNLTIVDSKYVKSLIVQCILGTDMAHHFHHVELLQVASRAELPFDKVDVQSRVGLAKCIVHCADLSGQVLCAPLAKEWGRRCISEFKCQADKELKLGLEVTAFMIGLDDSTKAMSLQYGFVKNIVLPLWQALSDCFPNLRSCYENCLLNADYYRGQVDIPLESSVGAVLQFDGDNESTDGWSVVRKGKARKKLAHSDIRV
jgi:GAF domain-containing protein